ncbi:Nitrate reductase [Planctomycetes bacterium Pan216]|uniref:Nitrate reductase n=1 Tax=Kolteria novifilia TaxID=2527975 RepID=A0A518B0K4_9BACT|nr:Nitrate reductase [Planctomycetes bacterium Pan216]
MSLATANDTDRLIDEFALMRKEGPLTRQLLQEPGGFGLGMIPNGCKPDSTTKMVCGFCSTGCSLNVHLKEGEAVGLTPATGDPVNVGMACPKGWEAVSVLDSPARATTPLLRRNDRLEPVSWDNALTTFAERIKAIIAEHGPDSVAFISTGQIPTEEMAMLGALAKFGMGLRHGDGNTRQCMATAVVAYKQAFGFDAPPYTYQDFEESDMIVLVGSNLCIAHPIMWERVLKNKRDPDIVVIDPRCTETAMAATWHLQIKPKSDLALFYGVANILAERGWLDESFIERHTEGVDDFVKHVAPYNLDRVSHETGLESTAIETFARFIHERERTSFWWTMGINQSYEGVRAAQSIINLALLTGNIGRPGTGANSITGQCNAMGSRLFSNTTSLFAGRDFTNDAHRQEVAETLGIDVDLIPSTTSWDYATIMENVLAGKVKALWVIATNPAHSWINQNACRDILSRLDFLVVQDSYVDTETAKSADLVLPAAAWGEKEGTFINSERRLGVIKRVKQAPGQALADFSIFKLIAHYWGCDDLFREWTSPEATFQILSRLSKGQPCDISGVEDYRMIDDAGGIQWPCPEGSPPSLANQRRLFEDHAFYTPSGRARFKFEEPKPLSEPPDDHYPLILLTGRGTSAQWHTQTRTRQSAVLRKLYPQQIYVEINPIDAKELNLEADEWVSVESRRGRVKARAFLTNSVQPGQVFLPMHYEPVNRLTDAVFDPYSRQPSYKACAVRVGPWRVHHGV